MVVLSHGIDVGIVATGPGVKQLPTPVVPGVRLHCWDDSHCEFFVQGVPLHVPPMQYWVEPLQAALPGQVVSFDAGVMQLPNEASPDVTSHV